MLHYYINLLLFSPIWLLGKCLRTFFYNSSHGIFNNKSICLANDIWTNIHHEVFVSPIGV
uniref:Uncharacterized protein n=1 Tax=Lepeophtheirus salmonis TaxID=72036 RepID=A0A0K2V372_LEPSM